jgi:predicted ArsR family transcriptional regulator
MDAVDDPLERDVPPLASLGEPVRRRLYRAVVEAPGALSREQAAAEADVPVHTAKFHLDKLVDEGLLETEFRRLTGRTGPGSGRPAKLYRRSGREFAVSLPERQYDLLSRILATAVADSGDVDRPVREVAGRVARAEGEAAGAAAASRRGRELERLSRALAEVGYEPREVDGTLLLRNCPFHRTAQLQTELVCGLNLEYVDGLRDGLGCRGLVAALEPAPDRCCVTARRR